MGFSIYKSSREGFSAWQLKDEASGSEVSILPENGALLHAFRVSLHGETFNVIDNYKDLASLQQELGTSFKGAKLSPFPCRIADSRYDYDGKEYFFKDGRALHGLLYNRAFTVTHASAGEEGAVLGMEYVYRKTDPGYPHVYRCEVVYSLGRGNRLSIRTLVSNLGLAAMPLADGWHPYFRLGGSVNDWILQFPSETLLEFSEKLIPTGKLLHDAGFKTPHRIGDRALDNCFVLEPGWEQAAACGIVNPENGLRIDFYPDAAYPYLQLYIPPDRESIAIENLSGVPDCFNNEMGLIRLGAGHSQTFTVQYKVHVE